MCREYGRAACQKKKLTCVFKMAILQIIYTFMNGTSCHSLYLILFWVLELRFIFPPTAQPFLCVLGWIDLTMKGTQNLLMLGVMMVLFVAHFGDSMARDVGCLSKEVEAMLVFRMKCTGCSLLWIMVLTSPFYRITIICNKSIHVIILQHVSPVNEHQAGFRINADATLTEIIIWFLFHLVKD